MENLTTSQTASFFGVSVERIKQQYAENAKQLEQMYNKAVATGKKVNGFTAEYLKAKVTEYKHKAK